MRPVAAAVALTVALAGVANAVCGDRVLDPGEQCDDGNLLNGDCCDLNCNFEVMGTSCNDGSVCTTQDVCDGAGKCIGATHLSCGDKDPCTLASCHPADGCHNDPVDFAATITEFATPLASGDCTGVKIPTSIKSRFVSAAKLVVKGQGTTSPKSQRRLVDGAVTQLKRASGAVKKSSKHVGAACGTALRQRVNVARSRTQCLLKRL